MILQYIRFNQEEAMELISISHDLTACTDPVLDIVHNIEEVEAVKRVCSISNRLKSLIEKNLFEL